MRVRSLLIFPVVASFALFTRHDAFASARADCSQLPEAYDAVLAVAKKMSSYPTTIDTLATRRALSDNALSDHDEIMAFENACRKSHPGIVARVFVADAWYLYISDYDYSPFPPDDDDKCRDVRVASFKTSIIANFADLHRITHRWISESDPDISTLLARMKSDGDSIGLDLPNWDTSDSALDSQFNRFERELHVQTVSNPGC